MNCQRRDTLRMIRAELHTICVRLEEVQDEEENALAAMPESFQFSTRGDAMEDAVRGMDAALSDIQTAMESIEEITECQTR